MVGATLTYLLMLTSKLETKYEVWFTPKGGTQKKYSEAPNKETADRVATALKTAGTAEVRGPLPFLKAKPTPTPTPTPGLADNLSGGKWWDANQAKYKFSNKIEDLDKDWGPKFKEFHDALVAAGAKVELTNTFRSIERQYLMYYAARIARGKMTAVEADKKEKFGIDIKWDHGDAKKSVAAAQEMVNKFGLGNNPVAPPKDSNHAKGLAVDMNVSWTGELTIKKKDGTEVTIKTTPRDGLNKDLWEVAETYGVKKFEKYNKTGDKPHWSSNGG